MESNNLKKPPLAAFLSAISPGIGVFYAENKVRTFLFFAYLCLALLILVTFFIPVFPTLFVLMVLFSPFFYGYYLFDAVKIANIYRSMNVFSISKIFSIL